MTQKRKKIKVVPPQAPTPEMSLEQIGGKLHQNDLDLVHDGVHATPQSTRLFTKPNLKVTKGKPKSNPVED